jgi:hypothetical protein
LNIQARAAIYLKSSQQVTIAGIHGEVERNPISKHCVGKLQSRNHPERLDKRGTGECPAAVGGFKEPKIRLGERRGRKAVVCHIEVALSDLCWAIFLTKGHLWEFLQRQGFMRGPIEIYGEMELLRLLDQFFDRALCFATEGYEQYMQLQNGS